MAERGKSSSIGNNNKIYLHMHISTSISPSTFSFLNSSSPNPPLTSTSNSNTISPTNHHSPSPIPQTPNQKNASLLSHHHNIPLHLPLPLLPLLPHHPPNSNFRPSNSPLSNDFRRRDCSSCFTIPTAAGGTAYAKNGDGDVDGNDKRRNF